MLSSKFAAVACITGSVLLGACSGDSNSNVLVSAEESGSTSVASGQPLESLTAVDGTVPDAVANPVTQPISTVSIPVEPAVVVAPVAEPVVITPPEPVVVVPVRPADLPANARIADQLRDGVLDNIVLHDDPAPITNGSWPQFTPDTSWTWQLLGDTNTEYEVDVYVLDMFQQLDGDVIDRLHAQGRQVICYFSAGTYEPWRPDAELFANVRLGTPHYAYPTETWVDVTSEETMKVMANRMDMAVALGCDGVELDNVDGFVAETGLDITFDQELAYQRQLANEAHKRNLAVALKNAVEMIPQVADYFDLAINEVCFVWDECGTYNAIISAGKPVFHVEYDQVYVNDPAERAILCARSAELNMRTLVMPKLLDGSFRLSCD